MRRRRTFSGYGFQSRRVRLMLTPKDWADLEHVAERSGSTVEACIEVAVKRDMATDRALNPATMPVYYDAQGREHEEGDVREGAGR